ncbi:NADH dehydrogenase [ubiquinone] 1 beta subcomplex subunit 5, mitochondrial-like [Ruditapes philippinarum]|uniref:NADH dehydrogenase [ubiquinone] 1 beta subcomplex subunit 5, mitochondrial-like n=1 Tax=Ruditapes philippinarum TaxID=129788 RepID=UPI00295B3A7A|nr:NADH dehydrogenase [ubiquinone] 1 beta subcomplex subunit 5, mitochondrial-like [Ruditapes philippinarum]
MRNNSEEYGGHKMVKGAIQVSKISIKDDLYYFLGLGIIPAGLFITYLNVTQGPAQLVDTPEGYVPEPHEYHRLPLTRLLAKYGVEPIEKKHERTLYYLHKADEKRKSTILQMEVRCLQKEKPENKGWYYVPTQGQFKEREDMYGSQEMVKARELGK